MTDARHAIYLPHRRCNERLTLREFPHYAPGAMVLLGVLWLLACCVLGWPK